MIWCRMYETGITLPAALPQKRREIGPYWMVIAHTIVIQMRLQQLMHNMRTIPGWHGTKDIHIASLPDETSDHYRLSGDNKRDRA
ncbi:MAG: hypothetical protein RPU64_04900 [Candidatus Sedimenticola sp. (ex Thyasira tokunagai)]